MSHPGKLREIPNGYLSDDAEGFQLLLRFCRMIRFPKKKVRGIRPSE